MALVVPLGLAEPSPGTQQSKIDLPAPIPGVEVTMNSLLFVLMLAACGLALLKHFSSQRPRPADNKRSLERTVQLELAAINSELRSMLIAMGIDPGNSCTDLESLDAHRDHLARKVWDGEIGFPCESLSSWDDALAMSGEIESGTDHIGSSRFDSGGATGTMINPATGWMMTSGNIGGTDMEGNLFGSSAISDSIDSGACSDGIEPSGLSDSFGAYQSFDSIHSDPFSIH